MKYLLVLLVLLTPVVAGTEDSAVQHRYSWKLQVIYPDGEKKDFFVSPYGGKIPLKSKVWKCEYLEPHYEDKSALEMVRVRCTYRGVSVVSSVVCMWSGGRATFDVGGLSISEPKSSAWHEIILICQ